MKRIFLIYGDPRSGKTSLAEKLSNSLDSLGVLSLDKLYVSFIKAHCAEFYFDRLRNYIRQHYHYILDSNGYTKSKYGRDYIADWHNHILNTSLEEMEQFNNVIVEGYLLVDCVDWLKAQMAEVAQVFVIHVSKGKYWFKDMPVSESEILILGQTDN